MARLRRLWVPTLGIFQNPNILRRLKRYGLRDIQTCGTCMYGSNNNQSGCIYQPIIERVSEEQVSITSTCSGLLSIVPKNAIIEQYIPEREAYVS